MKRREYTLEPETVAERDGITALKLAVSNHANRFYTGLFAFDGKLMATAHFGTIESVRALLYAINDSEEVDQYGRDANGIDIAAALRTLEQVKGV